MKPIKFKVIGIVLGLLLTETSGFAAEQAASTEKLESSRMKNKMGSYLSIAEPVPSVIGVNLAYNITDFLRATAGYGKVSVTSSISFSGSSAVVNEATATTIGMGLKGFVPGWDFSPTAGLHFANISYSGASGLEIGGFKESGSHLYTSIGFDWQAENGLNINGGYRHSFKSGIGGGFYLGAGWFVNWLA